MKDTQLPSTPSLQGPRPVPSAFPTDSASPLLAIRPAGLGASRPATGKAATTARQVWRPAKVATRQEDGEESVQDGREPAPELEEVQMAGDDVGLQLAQDEISPTAGESVDAQASASVGTAQSEALATAAVAAPSSGLLAFALLGLAGAGGGGSSSSAATKSTNLSGSVTAGNVVTNNALYMVAYRADGVTPVNGAGTENSSSRTKVQDDGTFHLTISDYTGPVILKVQSEGGTADYTDEATGDTTALTTTLMATGIVEGGQLTLHVNPLTTVAAKLALNGGIAIDAATLRQAQTAVASALGLASLADAEADTTTDATPNVVNPLGAILAGISGIAAEVGGQQAAIDALTNAITRDGSTGTLSADGWQQLLVGARYVETHGGGQNVVGALSDLLRPVTSAIAIDAITSDNLVERTELTSLVIRGKVAQGATAVALTLAGQAVAGTVQVEGTSWSYALQESDWQALGQDGAKRVQATMTMADRSTASAQRFFVLDAEDAPLQAIGFANVRSIAEGTTTAFKVADLVLTDPDGYHGPSPSVGEASAALFEVQQTSNGRYALWLKAGAVLDYESHSSYLVTVSAGNVSQSQTVNITDVNEAPSSVVLTGALNNNAIQENTSTTNHIKVADITVTDDALGSNTLSLAGTDKDSFEIVDGALYLKAGVVLNFEQKSSYAVTVQASDASVSGASPVSRVFALTVNNANDAPTVTSALQQTATQGGDAVTLSLLDNASDEDGDTMTVSNRRYTVDGVATANSGADLPSGLSMDSNLLALAPTSPAFRHIAKGATSTIVATYTISDGKGGAVEQTATFTVTGINDRPTVSAALSQAATEGGGTQSLDLLTNASDLDDNTHLSVGTLSYTVNGTATGSSGTALPAGVTLSGTTLSLDPGNAAFNGLKAGATQTIIASYTISDGAGGSVEQTATFTVTGNNDVPTAVGSIAAQTAQKDQPFSLNVTSYFSDLDVDDSRSYSLTGAGAAGLSIDANGVITGTLSAAHAAQQVVVTLTDGSNASVNQSFNFGVSDGPAGVQSVALSSATGAQNNYLNAGDTLVAQVVFTQAVTIGGAPRMALQIGSSTVYADYTTLSQDGRTVSFSYQIRNGQNDDDGIAIGTNALELNGGSIGSAGGTATSTHDAVNANASYKVDTTAPTWANASFSGSTLSLGFGEAVHADTNLIMDLNPVRNLNDGAWAGTAVYGVSLSGDNTGAISYTLTDRADGTATVNPATTDWLRIQYRSNSTAAIADLAGNRAEDIDLWVGGGGNNSIDLRQYGSDLPITVRGNGGSDAMTGSSADDKLVDGGGADTLKGGMGADVLVLVENGGVNGGAPFAKDIVAVGPDSSSRYTMDVIREGSNVGSGFDIASAAPANHDVLSLPSAVIAANTSHSVGTAVGTLARHSISSGILTFESNSNVSALIASSTLDSALDYLETNFHAPGATVAFKLDADNNGTADSLIVYQDNDTYGPDTVVAIKNLVGIESVTLGTSASANVLQLVDKQAPDLHLSLSGGKLVATSHESMWAGNLSQNLAMLKNGSIDMAVQGHTGDGSNVISINADATFAAGDWVALQYSSASTTNGFYDSSNNVTAGDTGWYCLGGEGDTTINLSTTELPNTGDSDATLDGKGGNDMLTGGSGSDWISGGSGADLLRGGDGADDFVFTYGDSPAATVNLGGNNTLSAGDVFSFVSGVDRVLDFAVTDQLYFPATADGVRIRWMYGSGGTPTNSQRPTDGLATDGGYFLVQGTFDAANRQFTVSDTADNSTSTLLIYDGDAAEGRVSQSAVVIDNVALSHLHASTHGIVLAA